MRPEFAKIGPPLRPNSHIFVSGLKRMANDIAQDNDPGKRKKNTAPENLNTTVTAINKENYNNFINYLSKEMEVTYKMRRARG